MVLLIIFLPHFIDFSENVLWTLAKNCDQLVGGYTCVCVFVSVHVYGIGEVPSPIFNFCNENIIFWEPIQGFRIEATLQRVCIGQKNNHLVGLNVTSLCLNFSSINGDNTT